MGLRLMADKHPQPRHEPADGRLTSVGAMPEKTVAPGLRCCFTSHWLLIHAFFNLNRVCKTGTLMPLFLTFLIPEAASSSYISLHVGKDANVISI